MYGMNLEHPMCDGFEVQKAGEMVKIMIEMMRVGVKRITRGRLYAGSTWFL